MMQNIIVLDAARAAIAKMFESGHFSICTIDQILKMTGGIPPKHEYEVLRTLHCVEFKSMSQRLRLELPRLLQIVLESQPVHFELFAAEAKNLQLT